MKTAIVIRPPSSTYAAKLDVVKGNTVSDYSNRFRILLQRAYRVNHSFATQVFNKPISTPFGHISMHVV